MHKVPRTQIFRCGIAAFVWLALRCVGQEPSVSILPIDPAERIEIQSAMRARDYVRAEELVARNAEQQPKSQALLLFLADVLFLDSKQLNSLVVLKKAEALGPLEERHQLLLALCYVALQKNNLAIPEFRKLAESHPASAVYPYWLSRLAYRKLNLEEALRYAKQAAGLDLQFEKAFDQLGLCYAAIDRDNEAILAFKEAIRLNHEKSLHSPWPSMNLGTLFLRLNRLDEAEESLRQSVALEPQFPVSHLRLGQVPERKGEWSRAAEELQQAARLDPTYPEPHYVLARVYRKHDDAQAAAQELRLFENLRREDGRKGIVRPD